MRALRAALGAVGWAIVALAAALGVSIAAVSIFATTGFGRRFVASRVIGVVDAAVAGRLELEGIGVLPTGAIELRGLEVFDPDGHLVLSVGRARVSADLTGAHRRVLGISAELESPSVLVAQEPDGGISLARAFAPSHPAPPSPERRGGGGGPAWTIHLSHLAIRGGELWWVDAAGATRAEASDLEVDARATFAADRARAEVRLRGSLDEPLDAPVSLDLVASRRGDAVRLPVLRAEIGGTTLSAIGLADLGRRTGRIAVTRLALDRAEARTLEPRAPDGADLAASAYAESDGDVATAAVRVEPAGTGSAGRADAAVATRIAAAGRALGFDVALDRIDPSRVAAGAPKGEVTLAGHGAASGRSAADLRGRVALAVSRSRLRGGEITRADVLARAGGGTFEVERLSAAAPGVTLDGEGRWKEGGAVAGKLSADGRDVGALARNVATLLGVRPPAVSGRAKIDATFAGTSEVPVVDASVDAPALASGTLALGGARIALHTSGRPRALEGRLDLRAATLADGARTLARTLAVRASVGGDEVSVSATASVPGAGTEPYAVTARGRFGERRETVRVSELTVAYPGTRWALAAPATVALRGPSVDRLELSEGPQRIALEGGLRARGEIDARLAVEALDLARLPAGIVSPGDGLAGELSIEARATGTSRHPEVEGRFSISRGGFRTLSAVEASGTARWDGLARRAKVAAAIARGGGGTLDVGADLPLPIAGRAAEPVAARLRAAGLEVEEIAAAVTGEPSPFSGSLSAEIVLEGRAGAPALRGEATLDDARYGDLDALSLWLSVEAPGDRVRVTAGGAHQAAAVLAVDAQAPFDLAEALARPAAALRALRRAPLGGTVALTSLDLARLAGRAGVPPGVAGRVDAHATVAGSLAAPRGKAVVEVAGGEWSGYRGLAAHVDLDAGDERVAAEGRVSLGREEALRFTASLGAPPERLGVREALRRAPLRIDGVVPGLSLASAAGGAVPLGGKVEGRIAASGTAGAPQADLELSGAGLTVSGSPLGAVRVKASYAAARATAEARLEPAAGGALRATFALDADLGIGAATGPVRDAPAEATLVADALDLGALPALAPGTVRTAAGKLSVNLRARGPLARLRPTGSLHVAGGRLAVVELGEWTGIAVDASATEDAIELSRLEVHRGKGHLSASGSLRGLRSPRAALDAHLAGDAFTVTRAGMDLATIDLQVDAGGSWDGRTLDVEAKIARGVIHLPNRTPRTLQSLDRREDIVVSSGPPRRRRGAPAAARAPAEPPYTIVVHAVAPRNLWVKSDDPVIDIELKADVRYEVAGSEQYAQGTIDVVGSAKRSHIALISGRDFEIERGRVQFTGGPPEAAMLDVQARYENPTANVIVNVTGPLRSPDVRMSSQPSLDQQQIAMLIATGKADLQPGAGGIGTAITGEEAGKAALAAVATKAFTELVAKKLPLDTVSVEPGALRAGKYVTDRIYVAYTRRLSADPQKGENEDEVRVEYQITSRWTLEGRYGNAQSGGANFIWTRNY